MSLRKIEVSPYSNLWPKIFAAERLLLENALGELVIEVHHIGSTSVPNLMAKPIIDILMVVNSHEELDEKSPVMERLGYEIKGEFGINSRRYFTKGGLDRSHQIHAFEIGSEHINRHLAFKDYLIAHPIVTAEYQDLKLQVLSECQNDIGMYCDGKEEFIKKHEQLALKWWLHA